jgi:hypothetical protein
LVLARKPQHQLTNLSRQRRPTAPTWRLSPLPAYQRAMPPQQRARSHQKLGTRGAWQLAGCGRNKCPISRAELRPPDLAAQNLELVMEHQQLDVLHIQTTTATNKRPEQRPNSKVEEREDHAADPPNLRPVAEHDTIIGVLHA